MVDLFSDGFESGDLTAWDDSSTDEGKLSAHGDAALHGSYGLKVLIDDISPKWCEDYSPNAATRYRVRFYIDPNNIAMADWDELSLFEGNTSTNIHSFHIYLQYRTDYGYRIYIDDRTDAGDYSKASSGHDISDAKHYIEVDWKASSAPGANDGEMKLWIDGTLQETVSNIDNDTEYIDYILFGVVNNAALTTAGTFYLDDFASNNDGSEIGVVPSSSASPSVSPSSSISASESPSTGSSSSISPSYSPSASLSPSSSVSPSVSPSLSPSASASPSLSPSRSISASVSPSPSPDSKRHIRRVIVLIRSKL